VRAIFAEGDFFEIFCNSSLQSCEKRDVKGLYRRARVGEIPEFTGISSPYEVPERPDLTLYTDKDSVDECVQKLLEFIEDKIAFDSSSASL
jgi:adenylylsulfate kinase